jgi:hypothetical protein
MIWGFLILGVTGFASGFISGRLEEKESLYRRFWRDPAETMDDIRMEARKRNL